MSGTLRQSKLWRFILVTAIFVILGPPAGGLVAWLAMGALAFASPWPFILSSYSEGILLALGTGMIVAGAGLWLAMTSWFVPTLATLIVNAIFFVLTAGMDFAQADYPSVLLRVGRAFLLPSLVAAWLCWLVTRELLRVQEAESSGA
ncbi:MAG: hypothetical protein AB7F09_00435 [Parvibaculaceae bacterium]